MAVRLQGPELTARTSGTPPYAKALQVAIIKSRLFGLRAFNKSGAAFYLQVHDCVGAPSDMTTLKVVVKVAADAHGGDTFNDGIPFSNGIYVYASQSASVLT